MAQAFRVFRCQGGVSEDSTQVAGKQDWLMGVGCQSPWSASSPEQVEPLGSGLQKQVTIKRSPLCKHMKTNCVHLCIYNAVIINHMHACMNIMNQPLKKLHNARE